VPKQREINNKTERQVKERSCGNQTQTKAISKMKSGGSRENKKGAENQSTGGKLRDGMPVSDEGADGESSEGTNGPMNKTRKNKEGQKLQEAEKGNTGFDPWKGRGVRVSTFQDRISLS